MGLPGPVLLIVGPLIGVLATILVCRWLRVTAVAGALFSWWLWAMVTAIPLEPTAVERTTRLFAGDTAYVFGRSLVLTEGVRQIALFFYVGLSVLFLISLFIPQGRYFVPLTMAILSPLAAVLMIEPFAFSALLLLLAIAMTVIVAQAGQPGLTHAALRYLIMGVLSLPLLLLASWMLRSEQAPLLLPATRLLLIGFAILLAGFPFHVWATPLLIEAPPLVSAFIFGLLQLVVMALIFDLSLATSGLLQNGEFIRLLRLSGITAAILAGLLAATAESFGRLSGSLLQLDMAVSLLTLTIGDVNGWRIAVSLLMARFVSLLLITAGLSLLSQKGYAGTLEASRGRGFRFPIGTIVFAYGCLSLLGMPLTIGFAPRWSVFLEVQLVPAGLLYFILLAMIGGMIGLLRSLAHLLAHVDVENDVPLTGHLWLQGLSALLLLVGLGLALFPQSLTMYANRLTDLFG